MLINNLMSGLRLAPNGLHLGHYLGCLTPLTNFKNDEKLFFVIRDKGASITITSDENHRNLLDILVDLSSTKYSERILFVLQSKLEPYYSPIADYLQNYITIKQLSNIHPHRKKIKTNSYNLTIRDYMFPIESISTYYILNADRILMNDDNLSVVKFANNMSKKISKIIGRNIFTSPILLHGIYPRLLGFNYEKVSKANHNAIFFSDEPDIIEHKLSKILSFKYFFRINPQLSIERSELRENFILPDSYLPFVYLRIFSEDENIEEKIQHYKSFKNIDELRKCFYETMQKFIRPFQERRNDIRNKKDILFEKLYTDTSLAIEISKEVLEHFRSNVK